MRRLRITLTFDFGKREEGVPSYEHRDLDTLVETPHVPSTPELHLGFRPNDDDD